MKVRNRSSSLYKISQTVSFQNIGFWFKSTNASDFDFFLHQDFQTMNENNQTVPENATQPTNGKAKVVSPEIWFWIIMGAIGVVAFFGNTLVIFLITTRRRLHTTCNSFILSLSLSDLLTAVTTIPGSFICEFGVQCSDPVFRILCNFFICASVGNVCTMTGDRFCRVVYPLRYPVLMSPKRVVLTIMIAWTLPVFLHLIPSLVILLSPTIDHQNAGRIFGVIQMFTFAILPCTGLLLAFAKISRITFQHSRRHRVQVEQVSVNSRISQQMAQQATRKSFSVLVLGVVIFLFEFCWTFSIYRGICTSFSLCKVKNSVIWATRIFYLSNTAANPVVYAILKQDIRRELVRTLSRTRRHIRGESLQLTETRIAAQSC